MLSKFLLVGVGGSGGKTLRGLRHNLELRLSQAGWNGDLPQAWQFLHIDSPVIQDGTRFPSPMLPDTNYLALSRSGLKYQDAYSQMLKAVDPQDKEDHLGFIPSDQDVDVDVTAGAGQFRGVGRTLVLASHDEVKKELSRKLEAMNTGASDAELRMLAKTLGIDTQIQPSPTVIVISSIAGGSGSGQFLEVIEMIKGLKASENWVHEMFNVLYAPDVFTEVDPQLLAGNAIFAMAEIMSGIWAKPTQGSQRLATRMATNVPFNDPNYKAGAKYNFMVGKGPFASQEDVYLAVSSSLATWMTDQEVNDKITAFSRGNYSNSILESNLPDNTGLKEANKDATPFMALGFGRVGLGKERFVQYSAERLARSAIDRMLFAHTLEDPRFTQKTEDEWVTFYAEKNLFEFINDVGLNEETEEHNDVIDAIRPNRDAMYSEFKNQVLAHASSALNPRTNAQSLIEWDDNLRAGFNAFIETYLGQEALARNEIMRPWVKSKKTEVLAVTSRYCSQLGIKPTAEILRRLAAKLSSVADELRAEAEVSLKYASDLSAYIRGELGQVPEKNQAAITADNPFVDGAAEKVVDSFMYRAEASLKQAAASLLEDMSENFIEPLKDALAASHRGLLVNKDDYKDWTEADAVSVPNRFLPSKNEKLLIETGQYPSEFSELVKNSVNTNRRENAFRVVIDEVIMGGLAIEDLDKRIWWTLIDTSREWVPTLREAREDSMQMPQSAKFDISYEPNDYLDRAMRWMKRMGSAFSNYINENLASYLNKAPDKAILQDRHKNFLSKLEEAINDGAPLVTINQGLLTQAHNGKPAAGTVVSTFPIDNTHATYEEVIALLIRKLGQEALGSIRFDAQNPSQSIDFFSVHQGVQPMVLDSIMKPIANYWKEFNTKKETRQSLLQHRRPRYLAEAIPMSEKPRIDVLRGFFVARTLGQFKTDRDLPEKIMEDMGPKLSVWTSEGTKWIDFPHPLLSAKIIKQVDFPGAILFSSLIAIVDCSSTLNLTPLEPYRRLQTLSIVDSPTAPIKKWIIHGKVEQGAPIPESKRAGLETDTLESRRTAVVKFLKDQITKYEERFAKQSATFGETLPRDLTWEIRDLVLYSLNALIKDINALDAGEEEDSD